MAKCVVLFFGVGIISLGYSENKFDYSSSVMVKLQPKTAEALNELRAIDQIFDGLDVLKRSYGTNDTTDIVVPLHLQDDLANYIGRRQDMLDLASLSEFKLNSKEARSINTAHFRRSFINFSTGKRRFDLWRYNSYDDILRYQEELEAAHPNCVYNKEVGRSYEGRPLILTWFSKHPDASRIFVDAGIHAREWVAPAMAIYLMDRLARSCSGQGNMLDEVSWLVLPMVNPDGYEYSRKRGNRMWRKTRSRHVNGCYGVDGNRNYGYQWGVSGISTNPCDPQQYPGPGAFSESETRAVRDVMMGVKNIKLYVSLHAYGQYLVYPWGFTGDSLPSRWRELDGLATMVSRAVQNAGGDSFTVTSAGKWYPAAGGSDDYAFAVAKIPFSYTMELTDGYEFTFPERKLQTALPQYYEGFKAFGRYIAKRYPRQNS